MKKGIQIFCLLILTFFCFVSCDFKNPWIEKWWQDERTYDPVIKNVPVFTTETVTMEVPSEVIYKYVTEIEYIQLPPEIIYQIVTEYETVYKTITETIEVIVEKIIEKEVIKEVEVIKEIVVEKIVTRDPTDEEIIEYIKQHPEVIKEILKESEMIREMVVKEVIENYLENYLTKTEIMTIIEKIPANEIISYLTEEQVEYIIKENQKVQKVFQTINIIDIEFIVFSGNARIYNGPAVPATGSNLTDEEKKNNNSYVFAMAKLLRDNPNFMIILHGHANPTIAKGQPGYEAEQEDLKKLSIDRATNVEKVLEADFNRVKNVGDSLDGRVSITGYGGENTLSSNSTYAGLNRRVEMILIRIDTITEDG